MKVLNENCHNLLKRRSRYKYQGLCSRSKKGDLIMKKKWSKIWKEFNNWCDEYSWAVWNGQRRKLTQLIRVEFPNVNTRKLWACFNSECDRRDNKTLTLSWKKQQNVIKNAVATQRSNNG